MALNQAPFAIRGRKTLLLADGCFSTFGAKTAVCYLRYRTNDVVAVVDSSQAGRCVEDIVGFGGDVPVLGSVEEARDHEPEVAIVGTAPRGGGLDDLMRGQILECIASGIDIVSGLHVFLADDPAIQEAASRSGARLWDVRRVVGPFAIGSGEGCQTGAKSVYVAGTDCNVGKMTAAVELYEAAAARGVNAGWAATGQTGMMLRERGLAIDRVIVDFVGGATEELVNVEGEGRELVIVEGQGSIVHPGYAGVTLGLMFGAMPDCMVLVHAPTRQFIGETGYEMPSLRRMVALHEIAMEPLKKSPVAAIALNTYGLSEAESKEAITGAEKDTNLVADDPVRFGAARILEAVRDRLF